MLVGINGFFAHLAVNLDWADFKIEFSAFSGVAPRAMASDRVFVAFLQDDRLNKFSRVERRGWAHVLSHSPLL